MFQQPTDLPPIGFSTAIFMHDSEILAAVDNIFHFFSMADIARPSMMLKHPQWYARLVDYLRRQNKDPAKLLTVSLLHDFKSNLVARHRFIREIALARVRYVIQLAADIDAHCAAFRFGNMGFLRKPQHARQDLMEVLAELRAFTHELKVPICFEISDPQHPRSLLLRAQEHLRIHEQFGFGVALNLPFVQALGLNEEGLTQYLSILLPITHVVYFSQVKGYTPLGHSSYSEGEGPQSFRHLLTLIKSLGYTGPAIMNELPSPIIPRAFKTVTSDCLEQLLKV